MNLQLPSGLPTVKHGLKNNGFPVMGQILVSEGNGPINHPSKQYSKALEYSLTVSSAELVGKSSGRRRGGI